MKLSLTPQISTRRGGLWRELRSLNFTWGIESSCCLVQPNRAWGGTSQAPVDVF